MLRFLAVLASEMFASAKGDEVRPAPTGPGSDAAWVGRRIQGRYQIEAQLGAGGMGAVYRARHLALDRSVALKLLRKQHHERWVSRKRFEREARALAQLSHPNIVAVSDCGIDGDVPFLVMELLEGESLETRLRAGRLAPELAHKCALSLLDALAFVHERGLVHRDIKPGNIFLESVGDGSPRVKLLDFGLAKLVIPNTDATITRSGEISGTPAYMSPEQMMGAPADARTDVYATGLLLFEMLVGRKPFRGSESEVLRQQMIEPIPSLRQAAPDLAAPPLLDGVLQRATQKEPDQRYANAREMARALSEAMTGTAPARSSPRTTLSSKARSVSRGGVWSNRGGGAVSSLLRAGAILLSGLALAAILIAGLVIVVLQGPEGAARRVVIERALGSLLETAPAPPPSGAPVSR